MTMKLLALVLAVAGGVSANQIRGVEPSKQNLYQPIEETSGKKTWHCIGDPSIVLSYEQVNDDVCDCPDGSDEPGTNACAYNPEFEFYCANEGHIPGYIENFKLNDGVCDYDRCCDGSDEYLSGNCPNKCEVIHKQFLEYKDRTTKDVENAMRIKRAWIEKAEQQRKKLYTKLEELRNALKEKSLELEGLLKRGTDEDTSETHENLLTLEILLPFINSVESNVKQQNADSKDYLERINILEAILSKLLKGYNPNFNDHAVKEAVNNFQEYVSNRPQLLQKEDNTLEVLKGLSEEASKISYNSITTDCETLFLFNIYHHITKLVTDQFSLFDSSTNMGSENTKVPGKVNQEYGAQVADLEKQIKGIQSEISITEEDLDAEYGPHDVFRPIKFSWVSSNLNGYKYNIGLLDSIYQDNIFIGKFTELNGNTLSYRHGHKCWNGPNRSADVELVCGPENKLLSVSEPEKCEYYFLMQSPVACKELTDEYLLLNFKIDYDKL
ncbi:uncharacterized protein PRCAT00006321001 [Priceomyces carsonii]|uniref:uncharacterized protein n=1 Tax=Priceomyces carsonii TaxID=28549 RepID=UPI002EDA9368|nr:unnamed protein product [Priceomyces carsonii]